MGPRVADPHPPIATFSSNCLKHPMESRPWVSKYRKIMGVGEGGEKQGAMGPEIPKKYYIGQISNLFNHLIFY